MKKKTKIITTLSILGIIPVTIITPFLINLAIEKHYENTAIATFTDFKWERTFVYGGSKPTEDDLKVYNPETNTTTLPWNSMYYTHDSRYTKDNIIYQIHPGFNVHWNHHPKSYDDECWVDISNVPEVLKPHISLKGSQHDYIAFKGEIFDLVWDEFKIGFFINFLMDK